MVNTHCCCIVLFDKLQAISNTCKSCASAKYDVVLALETVFYTYFSPGSFHPRMYHHHHAVGNIIERFDRMHQDGSDVKQQVLFGKVGAHASASSSGGNDNDIVKHRLSWMF